MIDGDATIIGAGAGATILSGIVSIQGGSADIFVLLQAMTITQPAAPPARTDRRAGYRRGSRYGELRHRFTDG